MTGINFNMKKFLLIFIIYIFTSSLIINTQSRQKIENKRYGFSLEIPDDWKLYAEKDNKPDIRQYFIVYGLPKIWSETEKAEIENAVTISVYSKNITSDEYIVYKDLKNTDDLLKYELLRNRDIIKEKIEAQSSKGKAYIFKIEINGLKYKTMNTLFFDQGFGYVVTYTATEGTFDKNLPKYDQLIKDFNLIKRSLIFYKTDNGVKKEFNDSINDFINKQKNKSFKYSSLFIGWNLWIKIKDTKSLSALCSAIQYNRINDPVYNKESYDGAIVIKDAKIRNFIEALIKSLSLEKANTRELTEQELQSAWNMINFEISEPLCIIEANGKKLLIMMPEDKNNYRSLFIEELID